MKTTHDIQATAGIRETLEKYFLDIEWAQKFQEASVEGKKFILKEMSLEVDENYHTKEYFSALKEVLDFVERWNKQDHEKSVASAAQYLARITP